MNIKKLMIAGVTVAGFSGIVQAIEVNTVDNSIATQLCVTALTGNKAALHNQIKASGKSADFLAKNITCNGENILAFVEQYGRNSQHMVDMLDRSTRKVSITDIAQNNL